jgi:hypothetical protein
VKHFFFNLKYAQLLIFGSIILLKIQMHTVFKIGKKTAAAALRALNQ